MYHKDGCFRKSAEEPMSSNSSHNDGTPGVEANDRIPPHHERVLTTKRLRELLRHSRTSLITEALGDFLRHHSPEISDSDAPEIRVLFDDMVTVVRNKLDESGIAPHRETTLPEQTLEVRESRLVVNYAALLTWTSEVHGMVRFLPEEAESALAGRIELAESAVSWARTACDPIQTGICLKVLADCLYRAKGDVARAGTVYLEAVEALDVPGNRTVLFERVKTMVAYGQFLYQTGKLDDAAELVERIEQLTDFGTGDPLSSPAAPAFLVKGGIADYRKNYHDALVFWQQGLQLSDPDYDPVMHCSLLQSIALLYEKMEHPERGLELLLETISVLEQHNVAVAGVWVYVNAAESYHKRGDYTRAHQMLDRGDELLGLDPAHLPKLADQKCINVLVTRANLYKFEKNFYEAERILEWVIETALAIRFWGGAAAACSILGSMHGNRGRPDLACHLHERTAPFAHRLSRYTQLRLKLYTAQWKIANGEFAEASELLDLIEPEPDIPGVHRLLILRLRAKLAENGADMKSALAYERKASGVEQGLFEQNRERSVRYARVIAETRVLEQIMNQEKEQRRHLEADLAEALVRLGEKEKIIREIRSVVSSRNGPDGSRLSEQVLSVLGDEEPSDALSLNYLSNVDEEFVRRLRLAHPLLTPRQERLCVLLRAGLNAGEICTLMEIRSEGLKTLRKRIRKTLGLPAGEKLERMIAEI